MAGYNVWLARHRGIGITPTLPAQITDPLPAGPIAGVISGGQHYSPQPLPGAPVFGQPQFPEPWAQGGVHTYPTGVMPGLIDPGYNNSHGWTPQQIGAAFGQIGISRPPAVIPIPATPMTAVPVAPVDTSKWRSPAERIADRQRRINTTR